MVNIRTICTNVNKFSILFAEYILVCCLTIFPKLCQLACLCNVSYKVETELLSITYMAFRLRRLTLKYTCPSTCWRRSDNPFFSPSYEVLYPSSGNDQDLLPRWAWLFWVRWLVFSTRAGVLSADRLRPHSFSYYRVHRRESYFAFLRTIIYSLRRWYETRSLKTEHPKYYGRVGNYDTVFLRCLVETSAWINIIHSFIP
jgi:hypothetical protein